MGIPIPRVALSAFRYRTVTGPSEGSIIAAIMRVHMIRNGTSGIPMVPGILPMCRASCRVYTQATAARISSKAQAAKISAVLVPLPDEFSIVSINNEYCGVVKPWRWAWH